MKDRTIRPETTNDRIRLLTLSVDRYCSEQMNARKRALYVDAINRSIQVAHDQHELAIWLGKAWDFLDTHPALPDFTEREDRWLATLTAYESGEQAIADAKARLL